MQIEEVKEGFTDIMLNLIKDKTDLYSDFIFGMIIATALWIIYHRFVGVRAIKKSYEDRINAKNETISALRIIVSERLDQVEVIQDTKNTIFAKIKRSFKTK